MGKRRFQQKILGAFCLGFIFVFYFGNGVLGQPFESADGIATDSPRLSTLEALAQLCDWELDLSQNIMIFSESVTQILGLPGRTVSNEEFESMLLPESKEVRHLAQRELIEGTAPYNVELRVRRHPDGVILDIHSVANFDPETNTVFGTFLDITQKKEVERQLLASEQRQQDQLLILLTLQTGVIIALGYSMWQNRVARAHLQRSLKLKSDLLGIFHHESTSVHELVEFVLQEAMSLTNSAGGCICLYDVEQNYFSWEVCAPSFSFCFLEDERDIKVKVAQTGKALMDNGFNSNDIARYALFPTFESGKVVALVGLTNKQSDYSNEDMQLVSALMADSWSMIARKQDALLLREERNRLRTTLLSVGEGVITTDSDGLVEVINPVAEKLMGWSAAEAKGQHITKICAMSRVGLHPVQDVLLLGQEVRLDPDNAPLTKEGDPLSLAGTIAPILCNKGDVTGAVVVFRDVTVERQQQKAIKHLVYHDPLTGLYNRRSLLEQVQALSDGQALPLSVILGDVNGLKLVNDTFGHSVGDKLLQRVAKILRENCRTKDIVGRWGGDEFMILLPETSEHEVRAIAKRLHEAFSEQQIASISISLALGWGTKFNGEEDLDVVFKMAENRMYHSKLSQDPAVSDETIQALMSALYETSKREERHSQRVSQLCLDLANELELDDKAKTELQIIGLFHDIGKIAIEADILNKPGKLTEEEWAEIKRHPEIGYRILNSVTGMGKIAETVLAHHERWDGSGYPRGLKGEQIPFMARIVAVADSYDAMVSIRPYRLPLARREALEELQRCAGTDFDPTVVDAFFRLVKKEKTQAYV